MGVSEESESLATHVAVCAERYEHLNFRLQRLEWIVMASSGTLIMGVTSMLVTLLLERI